MASTLNKLRAFSEWHDMDARLSKTLKQAIKRREATTSSQGMSYISFISKQLNSLQSALTTTNKCDLQTGADADQSHR
jgi:hypothetical protein